jgi:hypothetical protein
MLFSYCANIHPAETWPETLAALKRHVPAVRARLRRAPTDPFPVGLRLSAAAAAELAGDRALLRGFRAWLEDENLLAFTINGFPYGRFHGGPVKERVFLPDWSDPARPAYTLQLFELLAELVPEGASASVSTSPGTTKALAAAEPERLPAIRRALLAMAETLEDMAQTSRLDLHLGLEPEPSALLENSQDTRAFFGRLLDGLDSAAADRLRRRIGICYDTCHFAIAGEDAAAALDGFAADGLRLSKVHLSNALALDPRAPGALAALAGFAEPVYLHQVVATFSDGRQQVFGDLPAALADPAAAAACEWRVHFHIPVFAEPRPPLRSTIGHLDGLAAWLARHPGRCRHFEVETYTFDVLPPELRADSVEDMLAAEIRWCETRFFTLLGSAT